MEAKSFIQPALADYIESVSVAEHPALANLRRETSTHPERQMQITTSQGQLLQILVGILQARRTLEIGVFTGYSSLAVALALPADGHITALDVSEEFTSIARLHWAHAGVADKITLHIGPASQSLDRLIAEGKTDHYDFAFIDADKPSYWTYFEKALELVRPQGLIAIDNTLQHGRVADPEDAQPNTHFMREFNKKVAADRRVLSLLLPIADGFTLAMKL